LALLDPSIKQTARLLAAVADHHDIRGELSGEPQEPAFSAWRLNASDPSRPPQSYYDAPLRSSILLGVLEDLDDEPRAARIIRCRWDECRRIFYGGRRGGRYHSRDCANRAQAARDKAAREARSGRAARRATKPAGGRRARARDSQGRQERL